QHHAVVVLEPGQGLGQPFTRLSPVPEHLGLLASPALALRLVLPDLASTIGQDATRRGDGLADATVRGERLVARLLAARHPPDDATPPFAPRNHRSLRCRLSSRRVARIAQGRSPWSRPTSSSRPKSARPHRSRRRWRPSRASP